MVLERRGGHMCGEDRPELDCYCRVGWAPKVLDGKGLDAICVLVVDLLFLVFLVLGLEKFKNFSHIHEARAQFLALFVVQTGA